MIINNYVLYSQGIHGINYFPKYILCINKKCNARLLLLCMVALHCSGFSCGYYNLHPQPYQPGTINTAGWNGAMCINFLAQGNNSSSWASNWGLRLLGQQSNALTTRVSLPHYYIGHNMLIYEY